MSEVIKVFKDLVEKSYRRGSLDAVDSIIETLENSVELLLQLGEEPVLVFMHILREYRANLETQ